MAAAYLFHLCQNHPFIDGNKRVLNRIEDSAVVQAKRQAKPPGETAWRNRLPHLRLSMAWSQQI